jgi:molybdopterin molybdotransferase
MIDVSEALEIIKSNRGSFGTESVPLSEAIGRILREEWYTDRPLPPYDRVTMDGIAISYEDFADGQRTFNIEGIAAAGDPQKTKEKNGCCLEVMTGAILPIGCDTIIRYEDLSITDEHATIKLTELVKHKNVHFKGSDRAYGELVAREYTVITSAEIGLGASIGKSMVQVAKLPTAIVISTGNELVPIDVNPLAHQIRKSNIYRMSTVLNALGISYDEAHLDDVKAEIKSSMQDYLDKYDLILLSGGVSKGKFDFLPAVLEELGANKLFHKVAQRPGKPFWFGRKNACTIFAFPGNPVSSFVCMHRYFIDWLEHSLGALIRRQLHAVLTADVKFKPDLTYFLEVKISSSNNGQLLATPQKGNGSGDLANLVEADAIIQLPKGQNVYKKGEVYPIFFYK